MRTLLGCGLSLFLLAAPALATKTELWVTDTAQEMLTGQGNGVGVTADGRLIGVAPWSVATALEEPIVLAAVIDADGALILGTGHPGRLYRLQSSGSLELLAEIPEEQITALHVARDGSILVAAVSPGALYRFKDGILEEVGRLGEGGFWDLAEVEETVVAAAGPPASLYRVTDQGLQRWAQLPDTHARSLAVSSNGLVVGTSGRGLIFRVTGDGQTALLADSKFTEIPALEVAADGSVWATALVGEPETTRKNNGENATTETGTADLDLPKIDGSTATSELLRLTPEGALLMVHRFAKQVASALCSDGNAMLVGTGFEGEVWRFTEAGGARLGTVDAVQVMAVLDGGAVALTQGPAQVLRRDPAADQGRRFRIDAKTFELPVRFGEYRIDPPLEGLRIRFRSGASEDPDDSWLPWTEWLPGSGGVVRLPAARSLQWEMELPAGLAAHHAVERVEVAYHQVNLPPRFKSVKVAEPGAVFLNGPPPSGPVIDASHPDVSGIFTVLDPSEKRGTPPGKQYWRVGYRTVSWEVEDPNKDPLRFELEIERRDGFRLPVRDRIEATQLGVDVTAVPDGWYRFRVAASDAPTNPGRAQQAVGLSEWFVVDNTPPEVTLRREEGSWVAAVRDAASSLARAEWSRDGESWNPVAAEDGLLDGREETFRFAAAAGGRLVVVRVIDRHHNRTTTGVVEE